ncbi:hypothetical protein [Persephonella sp.]|uniref:hypothetical protein n=1 Tax=Persephonella sp. TaxID=2060922 RepID=UPI002611E1DB|nr:hypothetical protein [Persephonella sp.]
MEKNCFETEIFKIHGNEEKLTNPRIYCANWLKIGYKIEDLFPEDWSWCIVVRYKPFFLCVARNGKKTG